MPADAQDIGEGWWEGVVNGKSGLFPESYIELGDGESGDDWEEEQDDWEAHAPNSLPPTVSSSPQD